MLYLKYRIKFNRSQENFFLIEEISITQRTYGGYINATALCKISGKDINKYLRNKTTKYFLEALSADIRIPILELVQIIKNGIPLGQKIKDKIKKL